MAVVNTEGHGEGGRPRVPRAEAVESVARANRVRTGPVRTPRGNRDVRDLDGAGGAGTRAGARRLGWQELREPGAPSVTDQRPQKSGFLSKTRSEPLEGFGERGDVIFVLFFLRYNWHNIV